MKDARRERFSGRAISEKSEDHRDDYDRDCDRILYSGAFRRLAVITQVVSPAGGHAFHNRLTHVLKVSQVGRRIAERLCTPKNRELIEALGGLNPSVVAAAGMAHDLGHPPFGHIAEEELDAGLRAAGERDGYEGNAQSFRIVTRLEIRESGRTDGRALGLDLTRAALNAILKYPRLRVLGKKALAGHQKFGAYRSEKKQFDFARQNVGNERRSLEAEIMDWADDITYAIHDLEDFYRAGKIPLDRLAKSPDEVKAFLAAMKARLKGHIEPNTDDGYVEAALHFLHFCPVSEPYSGKRTQRAALRGLASSIIHQAVCGTVLGPEGLLRPQALERQVTVLKQLTWHYVIEDSRLAGEQFGKRAVIRKLFDIFADAATESKKWKMFPPRFQEQLEDGQCSAARTAADYVSSLGEQRAVELYCELLGIALKPVATGMAI